MNFFKSIFLGIITMIVAQNTIAQVTVQLQDSIKVSDKKIAHAISNSGILPRFGKLYFPNYRYGLLAECDFQMKTTRVIDIKDLANRASDVYYSRQNNRRVDSLYALAKQQKMPSDFVYCDILPDGKAMVLVRLTVITEMHDNNGNEFYQVPKFFLIQFDLNGPDFELFEVTKPGTDHAIPLSPNVVKVLKTGAEYLIWVEEITVKDPSEIQIFGRYKMDTTEHKMVFLGLAPPKLDERFSTTKLGYNMTSYHFFDLRGKTYFVHGVTGVVREATTGEVLFKVPEEGYTVNYEFTGTNSLFCLPGWLNQISSQGDTVTMISIGRKKDPKTGVCDAHRDYYKFINGKLTKIGKFAYDFGAPAGLDGETLYVTSVSDDGIATISKLKIVY